MSSNKKANPSRRFGVLLHPTSLCGRGGVGVLGAEARRFVDWLSASAATIWQVLPLGPTGYGNSPYATLSAFAGNPLLIDLESLVAGELLSPEDLEILPQGSEKADFKQASEEQPKLLKKAWDRFKTGGARALHPAFHAFCDRHSNWLNDFAWFTALKSLNENKAWTEWPAEQRKKSPALLQKLEAEHGDRIGEAKFIQWLFFEQWSALQSYARSKSVQIMGDVPIFVAHDSADVWAHQELFDLKEDGRPSVVAGVPPDYFSETGQLWGNPLYRWDVMKARGYEWWLARLALMGQLCDIIRIDHFRGFEAYWEIPGDAKTAVGGRWVKGPGADLFRAIQNQLGELPFVAEDLGVITPEVEALRDGFNLPGMRILQFAFGGESSAPFLPHNHIPRSVTYLGTHDNDTTMGWLASIGFEKALPAPAADASPKTLSEYKANQKARAHLRDYLQLRLGASASEANRALLRAAFASVSELSIVAMQDVLELGTSARMNTPAGKDGNWEWRLLPDQLKAGDAARLKSLAQLFGRDPSEPK